MFSCEICEIFKNTCFEEYLQTIASNCSNTGNLESQIAANNFNEI